MNNVQSAILQELKNISSILSKIDKRLENFEKHLHINETKQKPDELPIGGSIQRNND